MSRTHQNARQRAPEAPDVTLPQRATPDNSSAIEELIASDVEAPEESFLGSLEATFGSAIVDHRAKLTTEDELLDRPGARSFPKRWEDNKLQVPRRAQRPLHADVESADGTYRPLDLDTHSMDELDPRSTCRSWFNNGKDCAKATYASLEAMGYEPPTGDKNSLLKRGEIGDVQDGNLEGVDPEVAKRLLDSIDSALLHGTPVMVGVDYPGEQTATNLDGVTDHWILVTGRAYDKETGEVRYQAMDNATAQAPARYFTVGEDYGLTSDAPEGAGGVAEATYSLTNARIPERAP